MNWIKDEDDNYHCFCGKLLVSIIRHKINHKEYCVEIMYDDNVVFNKDYTKLSSAKRGARRELKVIFRDIFHTIFPTFESLKGKL